jgi:hypothetical protein
MAGRTEEALEVARDLEANLTFWDPFFLAEIYTLLGNEEEAFRWLEEGYTPPHHPYIPWIGSEPLFGPLFDDPRFVDLQRRMHLPEDALVGTS